VAGAKRGRVDFILPRPKARPKLPLGKEHP